MVQELCPRMKQEPQILEQLLERIIRLEGEVTYLRAENQYLRSEVTRLERKTYQGNQAFFPVKGKS